MNIQAANIYELRSCIASLMARYEAIAGHFGFVKYDNDLLPKQHSLKSRESGLRLRPLRGRLIFERAMRAHRIVIVLPRRQNAACMEQRSKPLLIQTLVA